MRFKTMEIEERKRHLIWLGAFVANGLFLIYVLLPPDNLLFSHRVDFSFHPLKILGLVWKTLFVSFVGNVMLGLLLHGSLLIWFYQRRLLPLFFMAFSALYAINSIYYNTWHEGMIVLTWLFLVVCGFAAKPQGKKAEVEMVSKLATTLICLALLVQCFWSFKSIRFDIQNSYSGAQAVANYLRDHQLLDKKITGINFQGIAVTAFFDHNIYDNYHNGDKPAYWDWSRNNPWFYGSGKADVDRHMREKVAEVLALQPDVIIVGIKLPTDRTLLHKLQKDNHYQIAATFEGQLYWKTAPLEYNSFALLRPTQTSQPREGGAAP